MIFVTGKEEMPSAEEMEEGLRNLAAHNNTVDFIVTHCCSSSTQALLTGSFYKPDTATTYLEQIKNTVSYKSGFSAATTTTATCPTRSCFCMSSW